jgi:hypothetical protein
MQRQGQVEIYRRMKYGPKQILAALRERTPDLIAGQTDALAVIQADIIALRRRNARDWAIMLQGGDARALLGLDQRLSLSLDMPSLAQTPISLAQTPIKLD